LPGDVEGIGTRQGAYAVGEQEARALRNRSLLAAAGLA